MFAAIEIHNKPVFHYRYEVVVLLMINAWELILKSYLYKFTKTKIFQSDGISKPFLDCLNATESNLGKEFLPTKENLSLLYGYRNKVAHFYSEKLDVIIYSLLKKSLIFYDFFIKKHFKIDMSNELGIVLIPIGFKKFFSPLNFLTNESAIKDSNSEVKKFVKDIIDSSTSLNNQGIDEPIIVDFKMNLTNINRIKNADIVAGIDNSKIQNTTFSVTKNSGLVKVSPDAKESIILTRDKNKSQGVLLYEELSDGIFDEINNIVDANKLLAKGDRKFMLGQTMYFRIYAERQFINFNLLTFEMLVKAGLFNFYAPSLFWLSQLSSQKIKDILDSLLDEAKSPNVTNLIKLSVLLGDEISNYYFDQVYERYRGVTQPPQFYYTFSDTRKYRRSDTILKALKSNGQKKLTINTDTYEYRHILNNPTIGINILSSLCMDIYNGDVSKRSIARELDFLSYGDKLRSKSVEIIELIKNH